MLCVLSLYNYACVYKDFVPVSVSIVITPWAQYGKPPVVLTGTQDASAHALPSLVNSVILGIFYPVHACVKK